MGGSYTSMLAQSDGITIPSGEVLSFSSDSLYRSHPTQLTKLTVKTGVFINHNKVVLLSFHGSPHILEYKYTYPFSFPVRLPFPLAYFRANERTTKTPTVHRLRASDSFTLPSGSSAPLLLSLRWMHQAHSRKLSEK